MDFVVNDFEGPLDLLLKLIRDNKIDIYDIPIIKLTDQYLDYINKMNNLNLSVASDYLVMASELMYLKSKALVPNIEDDEEFVQEKHDLVDRLLEYQKYKDVSSDLQELEKSRKEMFSKGPSSLKEFGVSGIKLDNDITLNDLLLAFQKFMERKQSEEPISTKVTTKEYSVEERVRSIKKILTKRGKVDFFDLFEFYSKPYVIVTFLSILEMARKNEIKIMQEDNFDKITIEGVL